AAARGYDHLVHTLLDCGALVDALDPELETPLHKACFNGNLYVVEKLVMERANINKRDKHGWAPLHIAAAKNQRLVVDYLLGRPGIDVNLVNEKGMTPLMVASAKGLTGIVRVLLEK
ncbi:ankyrin repeat-containing domain protein, partial [Catenaria anguillulae PL171]